MRFVSALLTRFTFALLVAQSLAAGERAGSRVTAIHPPLPAPIHGRSGLRSIASISVCSPAGRGGAGSCPSGTFDTAQIVLAPDGSGRAFNAYDAGGTSDEHSSVFSPGTLGTNSDYLFFVASGTNASTGIGAVVLSGGSGPDGNGQWTFDYPEADGYGFYPAGFGQVFRGPFPQGKCPVVADGNPAHQDQTFDLGYAAPGSIVKDPTGPPGSVLMVYECTNACVGDNGGSKTGSGAYEVTAIATSLDYGRTWPTYRGTATFAFALLPGTNKTQAPDAPSGALGENVCMGNDCGPTPPAAYGRYPVLAPPVSLATVMAAGQPLQGNMGDSQISGFVDDAAASAAPYLYVVHNYLPGSGSGNDLAIARARLNGGSAALSFAKWDGQSFSSPGIGGTEGALLPSGSFQSCGGNAQARSGGSIDYVEETRQYLLLFACDSPGDPANGSGGGNRGSAWFYSTSRDLGDPTQWTAPQEITGSWSPWDTTGGCQSFKGWYPTLMSPGREPGHLSTSGYAFYLWGCEGGSGDPNAPQRQFSSRAFTITTQ